VIIVIALVEISSVRTIDRYIDLWIDLNCFFISSLKLSERTNVNAAPFGGLKSASGGEVVKYEPSLAVTSNCFVGASGFAGANVASEPTPAPVSQRSDKHMHATPYTAICPSPESAM